MATTRQGLMQEDGGIVRPLGPPTNDATISAALSVIGSSSKTLLIYPAVWSILNNLSIPANVHLYIAPGATFAIAAGKTLTILGDYKLFNRPCFTGAGAVVFAKLADVRDAAKSGDGTPGSRWAGWEPAVNALPVSSKVYFSKGEYDQSVAITMKENWTVYGDGPKETYIFLTVTLNPAWGFTGTIPAHANLYMHDFWLASSVVGTQTGIKFDGGFFARFERLYLRSFANVGWGLHCTNAITVIVDECDFEHNGSGGIQFGPGFVNDFRITNNLFGGTGSGFLSVDGFIRIHSGGSNAGLIHGNAFEMGTYGIVLGDCANTDIILNFFEFQAQNNISAIGTCTNVRIARNHLHNELPARIDLQFGFGGFAHEGLSIRDNQHVVFGASHTSIVLFNPGNTLDYEYVGNDVYPVTNRGIMGVVYVAGFVGDTDAFFRKDFVKYWGPPVIVNGSLNFGTATQVIQRTGTRFEFAAPVSTDSAVIRGAASEVEVFADHIVIQPNGSTVIDVLPTHVQVVGPLRMTGALGVGNSMVATTMGTVVRAMEVFDSTGASLGYVAIHSTAS
jgi:hypothetical protein